MLGSISGMVVLLMEFIRPLGLGIGLYFLFIIPVLFLITYRLLKKYTKYFNFILGSMNIILGILINLLLIYF